MVVLGTILLLCIGITVVSSVSDAQAVAFHVSANHFATRQLLFAAIGLVLAFGIVPRLDPHVFQRRDMAALLMVVMALGLVSVWVPGLADEAQKGSHRWLKFGSFKLQPSEFVRVGVCILMARWCGNLRCRNENFWKGTALPFLFLAPVLVLLLRQPDLGSTVLAAIVATFIMWMAGSRLKHLSLFIGLGAVGFVAKVLTSAEHMRRVLSFVAPDKVSGDEAQQIEASLQAFRNGGLFGRGYGHGIMKEGYLPEAHTDFILAMAGEELGLFLTLAVVVCYLVVLFGGWRIARASTEKYSKLLAMGLTLHFCLAAGANIAVVTRLGPTKGLALPLMSYGGSNMLASLLVLGLLLAVARHAPTEFDIRGPGLSGLYPMRGRG